MADLDRTVMLSTQIAFADQKELEQFQSSNVLPMEVMERGIVVNRYGHQDTVTQQQFELPTEIEMVVCELQEVEDSEEEGDE